MQNNIKHNAKFGRGGLVWLDLEFMVLFDLDHGQITSFFTFLFRKLNFKFENMFLEFFRTKVLSKNIYIYHCSFWICPKKKKKDYGFLFWGKEMKFLWIFFFEKRDFILKE